MLLFIFLILLTGVIYVYIRWLRLKQYWKERNVDYLPPHPLFGSMTFLMKENPASWFRRMYNYSKKPYIGMWIFWRPTLLVNGTDIAKNILIRDQANFRNRFVTSGTKDVVGRLNLFTLNDPLWSIIRKRLTILFTGSKLRGVQNLIIEKSKELVQRIAKENQLSQPINLRNMMTDFSTDIIGTSSFGVVLDATLTGTSRIKDITNKLMKPDLIKALAWCSGFFIPELADIFRLKLFPAECTEYMRKILREIIAQRGGLNNKVMEPRDLLDILIKMKQEGDEELDMTENMMVAQAGVFLQGGFDTTATSLSFIIYELAFCPEAQDKLFTELQEAYDEHGDKLLDASILSQLTYLNCVINEGFRKYPITSYLDRVALEDYKVDDRLTIKAGTPVYVNVMGIHYDPDFYPEPNEYNPDRFLPDNIVGIKPFTFLPFGEGPRKCIGQRLGLSAVRHAVTAIILNYEVKPLPNTPKPIDVRLEQHGILTIPEDILTVKFVPRVRDYFQ